MWAMTRDPRLRAVAACRGGEVPVLWAAGSGGGDETTTVGGDDATAPNWGSGTLEVAGPFGDEPLVVDGVSGDTTLDAERADAFDFPLRAE